MEGLGFTPGGGGGERKTDIKRDEKTERKMEKREKREKREDRERNGALDYRVAWRARGMLANASCPSRPRHCLKCGVLSHGRTHNIT